MSNPQQSTLYLYKVDPVTLEILCPSPEIILELTQVFISAGFPLPLPAVDVSYFNTGYPDMSNVQQALDQLLYVAPSVGISNNIGTVEIGTVITSVILNWSLNKPMVSETLSGPGTPGAITPPTITTYTVTGQHIVSNTTYSITVNDGTNNASSSTGIYFENKRFWGANAQAVPDQGMLASLSSELSTSLAQTRTISPSAQYVYFAWPSSFGTPTFTVNGLLNTAWEKTTFDYTNSQGYTTSYDAYRSQYLQSASQIIVVT